MASGDCRSRPRRAAHIDHVAVTDRGILVDEAGDQDATVERDDLAILLAGGGGDDLLLAKDRVRDLVIGGPGRDVALADRRDDLRWIERRR